MELGLPYGPSGQVLRAYLDEWLVVPDETVRDIDGIDTAPSAYAWGNKTWRDLRAIAAFAQAKSKGFTYGFYGWCKSGAPMCWPATQKKLAMSEFDSVQNNPKWANTRHFPVAAGIDPSGRIVMWSHLKVADGGGDLAPRVYFHDDTNDVAKKVHVGFDGPHHVVLKRIRSGREFQADPATARRSPGCQT